MKRELFLPLFSFAMLMGLFAFAEEKVSDAGVSAPKAEQTMVKEENPLINAVRTGDVKKVKELIKAGADVNAKDDRAGTALMLASQNGNNKLVELLIRAGADVNIKNKEGKTAADMVKERE